MSVDFYSGVLLGALWATASCGFTVFIARRFFWKHGMLADVGGMRRAMPQDAVAIIEHVKTAPMVMVECDARCSGTGAKIEAVIAELKKSPAKE